MANETITINLIQNREFSPTDTSSTTVGDLRNELEIPTTANVMVSGVVRQNDYVLEDNALVAYSSNNKVGG